MTDFMPPGRRDPTLGRDVLPRPTNADVVNDLSRDASLCGDAHYGGAVNQHALDFTDSFFCNRGVWVNLTPAKAFRTNARRMAISGSGTTLCPHVCQIVSICAEYQMPETWQRHTADKVDAFVIVPNAESNVAGVKNILLGTQSDAGSQFKRQSVCLYAPASPTDTPVSMGSHATFPEPAITFLVNHAPKVAVGRVVARRAAYRLGAKGRAIDSVACGVSRKLITAPGAGKYDLLRVTCPETRFRTVTARARTVTEEHAAALATDILKGHREPPTRGVALRVVPATPEHLHASSISPVQGLGVLCG